MIGVQKSFGATCALKNVSFTVSPGEVHALIGENGAGKSTLMRVLSGACQPDGGSIELDGLKFAPTNPLRARRCGIAMIYQELNLAPHLSVEENILLGTEPSTCGWLHRSQRREMAGRALAELHRGSIPLEAPVNSLLIADQQVVEIARALVGHPKVIIMDEPTSSLTTTDAENLFAVIRKLSERGVSVIYISHFLEECQRICHGYTVLRDGESIKSGQMTDTNFSEIIRLMVGREIKEIYPRNPHAVGEPVLELRALRGRNKPRCVSLALRTGEILGIAGLVGAGRTETLRTCFGLDVLESGRVMVFNQDRSKATPASRLAQGIGLLSENRKEEGLMLGLSLADNLTMTRFKPISRWGLIDKHRQEQCALGWMNRLVVRARGPRQTMGELSGGNQQKVAVARLLHHDAKIFLLDEPTRGIDVGSKAQIYRLMDKLASEGRAIVFVSSYLPELLGVCDTIGVMSRGMLSEVRPVASWTEHSLMSAAIGKAENGTSN